MDSKIYKFDYKNGLLDKKLFIVRDYFQYYTTGLEQIVRDNPSAFVYTNRNDSERPDQIMYSAFGDENLSDMFVAVNNQNYLWAVPFSLDAFQDAVELRMSYLRYLMRDRMNAPAEITETHDDVDYIPTVEDVMYIRAEEDIHAQDEMARNIFIPEKDSINFVKRRIDDYFDSRIVR